MKTATMVIVDDEVAQLDALAGYLKKRGHRVFKASGGRDALDAVRQHDPDLVLTDVRMPDLDGISLLAAVKKEKPETGVVVMTAFGSIQDAVEAVRAGASDYLPKPVDLDHLDLVIEKCLDRRDLERENRVLKEKLDGRGGFSQIISASPAMARVLEQAVSASRSRATVLILGESGTGKEVLARAIHLAGPRRDRPFIAVNLAAIPETLAESELFGHEKGAFTGADRARAGRFETAEGGTLFIDEIGDAPQAVQIKMLRVLQERTVERIGSAKPVRVDVRIIAATHRDLESGMREGRFREDLFYRLNVLQIRIPPLRERREEIPLLADHFLRIFSEEESRPSAGMSTEALGWLSGYDFPGNVRELENMIHRAVVTAGDEGIQVEDLDPAASSHPAQAGPVTLPGKVEELEMRLIREALAAASGNQSEAARSLGISERHLRYRMKKYGMK